VTRVVAGPGRGVVVGWCSWEWCFGLGERMSGTMYSSLRYLLPAQASGAEWSSRLVKRDIWGVDGGGGGDGEEGDERVGRG
jgi:hypothetical protein